MKKFTFVVLLAFIGMMANADIIETPFVPEYFEVEIYQHPHMILIENPESEHIDTYYTFTDKDETYQVRYTFFRQTNRNDPGIKVSFSFWAMVNMMNIAGHENFRVSNFHDNDVKNDFNGDFGNTVFIQNPASDFGEGYDYIMVNFYCKINQGIVVQSILMNDLSIVQTQKFLEIFHSFRFID